jgi:hypothetical protein
MAEGRRILTSCMKLWIGGAFGGKQGRGLGDCIVLALEFFLLRRTAFNTALENCL